MQADRFVDTKDIASARSPGLGECKVYARLLAIALVAGFAYPAFAGGLPSVVGD